MLRACRGLVVLLALAAASCGTSVDIGQEGPSTSRPPEPPSSTVVATRPCTPAPLATRAATVLMVGIGGATSAEDRLAEEVSALGPGGVILLGANVADAPQVRALIDGLRRLSPHGLLVSVDEEGGRVSRLRPIIGSTPSARSLGRLPLPEIAAVAAERGATLVDLGFDLVLAPVVDADGGAGSGAIGDRSFAAAPARAGERAGAFVEGLARAGAAATAKHFPGQGELGDSHDGTVVFDAPLEEVEELAAAAFGPALRAGARAVMMSHVTFPALGPLPASLEPAAYRLLRSLGFDGVAVTDALNMSAVVDQWPLPEAAVMALVAGADLVLAMPGQEASAMRQAIISAVTEGRLPEDRLDEAVARVLALRGESPTDMVCG